MIIPNLDIEIFVDKDGKLTASARLFLSQIVTLLQQNLSDEGYILPPQSAANITRLSNIKSVRGLLYNTDTNKAMICENGTYKTIVTS